MEISSIVKEAISLQDGAGQTEKFGKMLFTTASNKS